MTWLEYFHDCVDRFNFVPWRWDYSEDANLCAFASKEQFKQWYGQEPGPWHKWGVPSYRDESFYVRELTTMSMLLRPKRIVEFGTSLGIGTLLLRILNPTAGIWTIDNAATVRLSDGRDVEIGYLAKLQNISVHFVNSRSADFALDNVDLCFIDGDHSYEGVTADQERAWANRNPERGVIAWHDHNERHPGTLRAVSEFTASKRLLLQSRSDSCTVWTIWGEPK